MLIGEVAKLARLSKDSIRHYEQMGLIASTPRSAGGRVYREYEASVLQRIENIRGLQQLGFSLKEIGPLFKAHELLFPVPRETMVGFLEDRLAVVRDKIAALQVVEAFIDKKLDIYRAGQTPECAGGGLLEAGRLNPERVRAA